MVFCQLADCQSLRDIELGMKGIRRELGHLGIRKAPSRNALSRQNRRRNPWVAREVYRQLREKLLGHQPYRCAFRKGIDASRLWRDWDSMGATFVVRLRRDSSSGARRR